MTGVFSSCEQDGAEATRSIVWTEGDIGTKNGSGFAKEVFDVLPANAIWQLRRT
jgi:hypothetical protein